MGTGLFPTANHKIIFKNRSFQEIATEIKYKLDHCYLPNPEFLRLFSLQWYGYNWEGKNVRAIRKINNTHHWFFYDDSEYFRKNKEIEFIGPYELSLVFSENFITIDDPPYRYWQWFRMKDEYALLRNEWRKYIQYITTLFGGDRVVYLADNAHPLEEFMGYEGTFEELEEAMQLKLGLPQTSFKGVADNEDYKTYFIDDFKTIDWSKKYPLDEFLPIPDDTSNTDYNLNYYTKKEHLKEIDFTDEVLLYNRIDGKLHFYHLANVEGLLCEHTGIVGEKEEIKVRIDSYAPFIYDSILKSIESSDDSYNKGYLLEYRIAFKDKEDYHKWKKAIEEFYEELLWSGVGKKRRMLFLENGVDVFFDTVDKDISFRLLFDIAKKHNLTIPIKIYKASNGNVPIMHYP